jgi:hypothetical protein
VSQELQLPKAFINKYLKNFLFKVTKSYIEKSVNKKITKFKINNVWVVRQFENEYITLFIIMTDIFQELVI